MRRYTRVSPFLLAALLAGLTLPGLSRSTAGAAAPLRIGAVFPLRSIGPLAQQEYRGVEIARDMVNASGGIGGHPIVLDTQELDAPVEAAPVMESLKASGIRIVLGAYSSALSIPAAGAAARDGMVYWEAGAVADRVTGQGLPSVFRVGASGSDLGINSARFAAQQLAPRLGKGPAHLRISVVNANDAYANSVADAAIRQARAEGFPIASHDRYNPYAPNFGPILTAVRRTHPNILILASHIPDGAAFRRAFVAAHLYVQAFIGSTMAQCVPEFGALMGKNAIGVFASDRPEPDFNPAALTAGGRALYNRFASAWRKQTGTSPTEEGLSGFTAAWVLFHDVLPGAARSGLTTSSIEAAARSLSLPRGSLPNGAGVRFATDRAHLGQNIRAAAVIWQWQAVRHSVVVWPATYATGQIKMVPLPR